MPSLIESPLTRLTPEQIDALGREFDAIHHEVRADLGERDRKYITSMIEMHRRLVVLARIELFASRHRPAWLVGTTTLSLAKILENMEIGHNVMHGQWDWMNDPQINSSTWDWDSASTPEAWKHSHNYVHHTYTNIRGKDRDLGYEIMRIDPHQKWNPVYLFQPLYNLELAALFEWGVAFHDLDFDAIKSGEKSKAEIKRQLKGMRVKARSQIVKDYVAFPLVSAASAGVAVRGGAAPDAARPPLRCGAPRRSRLGWTPRVRRSAHAARRRHRQHRAQRLGLRDHLLRPLPRPDLHLQPGRSRRRDEGWLVHPPTAGRGEHRGQPAVPRHQRQPRLPGRAPSVPRHAEHPLRRDRAARSGKSASATSCLTTAARSSSSSAWCSARSCDSPSPAASPGPNPAHIKSDERSKSDATERGSLAAVA